MTSRGESIGRAAASGVGAPAPAVAPFDVERVRKDFPALARRVYGKPLVFLDSAASAHKPRSVLEAMDSVHRKHYANVHRGLYRFSELTTERYEGVREVVRRFVNARATEEIVFVRGATEGINLVAASWGRRQVGPGDEILITHMEHHADIVPWQLLCEERGARLVVAPVTDRGELDLEALNGLLSERTRLVAVTHVSNVLGTVNPVAEIVRRAHEAGARVLVDGAQAVQHQAVDVRELDCDFYVFSGHKMYGPTGIGVLYGKLDLLEAMPPYQGGGDMIRSVSFEKTEYARPPHRFEAGTPHFVGAIGLGAAIEYLSSLGLDAVAAHEHDLLAYATERLTELPGVRILGTAPGKASVVSLVVDGIHAHDVGTILDQEGIAVRAGHHCAQPLMERFGVPATARAAFGLYNTRQEVDRLIEGLEKAREVFGR